MLKVLNKYKMVLVVLCALICGIPRDIATKVLEKALIYVDGSYLGSVLGAAYAVAVLDDAILQVGECL